MSLPLLSENSHFGGSQTAWQLWNQRFFEYSLFDKTSNLPGLFSQSLSPSPLFCFVFVYLFFPVTSVASLASAAESSHLWRWQPFPIKEEDEKPSKKMDAPNTQHECIVSDLFNTASLNCVSIAQCRHTSLAGTVIERCDLIGQFIIAMHSDGW